MADEKKETEETVTSDVAATPGASTVKKTTVKKKTTRKKVAKKKATTKKAVAKKADSQTAKAMPESKPVPPSVASGTGENKTTTATGVAAASSMSAPQPAQANVNLQVKPIKKESLEETSMSNGAKSSSGFWVKVLFWLVILMIGFVYVRSLAKHPDEQGSMNTTQTETPAATSQVSAGTPSPVHNVTLAEKTDSADQVQTISKAEGGSTPEAAPVASQDAAVNAQVESQAGFSAEPSQTAGGFAHDVAGGSDAAGSPVSAEKVESMRDQHAESVSKILKEFDDLREAAQAEMDAMRNLMQAERELHDAMAAPPPAAYPPAWRGPAYSSPYATGPQYYPYARP